MIPWGDIALAILAGGIGAATWFAACDLYDAWRDAQYWRRAKRRRRSYRII